MVVCLAVGDSSEGIIKKLKRSLDNVKFHTYPDIASIIKDAKLRHINYNRIVVSNSIVKNLNELDELNEFIKDYSSNTEIIMLLTKKVDNLEEVGAKFCELFNSPMYGCYKPDSTTIRLLGELCSEDIIYISESHSNIKYTNSEEKGKTNKLLKNNSEIGESGSLSRENETNVQQDNYFENSNNQYTDNSNYAMNNGSSDYETEYNDGYTENGGISEQVQNNVEDFQDFGDDLSLGSFGESHSDTGFLDSSDEEDLKMYMKSRGVNVESEKTEHSIPLDAPEIKPMGTVTPIKPMIQEERESNIPEHIEVHKPERILEPVKVAPEVQEVQKEIRKSSTESKVEKSKKNKVSVIVAPRNNSVSQKVIDLALKLVNVNRLSVLIVDLDYIQHDILSYLDIEKFYISNSIDGLVRNKVYTEDGVGVVSSGYGVNFTEGDVVNFFNSNILSLYDKVIVYCPSDCLDVLPEKIISDSDLSIHVGGNVATYSAISLNITDREKVTRTKEKLIMSNCSVVTNGKNYLEELGIFSNVVYFANGSWVDRV